MSAGQPSPLEELEAMRPDPLDVKNPSVLDSHLKQAIQAIASLLGAGGDPNLMPLGMVGMSKKTLPFKSGTQSLVRKLTGGSMVESGDLVLSRLADEGGVIQIGFKQPISPETIKQLFQGQSVSVSPVQSAIGIHPWYKVAFYTPNGALDYNASREAVKKLGGGVWSGIGR